MLKDSLQQLAGLFSRRFLLNALLPTFVFVTLTTAVVVASTWTMGDASIWWNRLDLLTRFLVVLTYVAVIWFLSAVVASQWRGIVRLYEGYPLRHLAKHFGAVPVGVRWHQQRLDQVRKFNPDPVYAYYRYPSLKHKEAVLSTRLGNILLAGERYSSDHYGIDAIFFWPRLYPLLPETFQRDYEAFLINYEFPLVVSFEAAATAAISAAAVLLSHGSPVLFLATAAGGAVAAYLAYCSSLSSAEELAEQQRTAFDLYRDKLLNTWPTVLDVRDEKAAFRDIYDFVVFNSPPSWEESQKSHIDRAGVARDLTSSEDQASAT